jgi:hypothetical protein
MSWLPSSPSEEELSRDVASSSETEAVAAAYGRRLAGRHGLPADNGTDTFKVSSHRFGESRGKDQ